MGALLSEGSTEDGTNEILLHIYKDLMVGLQVRKSCTNRREVSCAKSKGRALTVRSCVPL